MISPDSREQHDTRQWAAIDPATSAPGILPFIAAGVVVIFMGFIVVPYVAHTLSAQ